MSREERQQRENAARQYLGLLYGDYDRRWNVDAEPNGIAYCPDDHEKGEPCSYYWVQWIGWMP